MRPPTAGEAAAAALAAPLAAWAGFVAAPPWTAGGRSPRSSRRSRIPFPTKPTAGAARDGRCCSWSCMPPARRRRGCSHRRNLRPGEEHGSARWGDARRICHRYRGRDPAGDKLLTRNFRMSYDTHAHRRSMKHARGGRLGRRQNARVQPAQRLPGQHIDGGARPEGRDRARRGGLLESRGYEVRVLDLVAHGEVPLLQPAFLHRVGRGRAAAQHQPVQGDDSQGRAEPGSFLGHGRRDAAPGASALPRARGTARGAQLRHPHGDAARRRGARRTTTITPRCSTSCSTGWR